MILPHWSYRAVAQLASASALGAEGRGFESHQPDHTKYPPKGGYFVFLKRNIDILIIKWLDLQRFVPLHQGGVSMSDIKEENVARRTIDRKTYIVEGVPNGERNATITANIKCFSEEWAFEGTLSPKRIELCIAAYLVHEKSLSQNELQFCAGIGTGMGLNAYHGLGFASPAEFEQALKVQAHQENSFIKERVESIVKEVVKNGDRVIYSMMLRSRMVNDARVFTWLNPSVQSAFDGVKEAFSESDSIFSRDPFNENGS